MAPKPACILRALANERRLAILMLLSGGELSVGEIEARLGVSQSALSQHLARLREARLVRTRREGQHVRYRLADPGALEIAAALLALAGRQEAS
ncbi:MULTISPECIES: ArsR/SmtB family transcription factor [Phenylobacterium]|uniref:ArsR/SmtB family transcription factor n=1 Tax=Phenylobacterium TaxID=20 RepID=UPI002F92B102